MRRLAIAVACSLGLIATSLRAQDRPPAGPPMSDPSAGDDPFVVDGGAPPSPPGDASVDPTLGPDPFASDGGAPSAAPAPPADINAPAVPVFTPAPTPSSPSAMAADGGSPVATVLPPPRSEEADDEDALVFGGKHAQVRLTLLVQPQLAWEFFNAAASPNLRPDGTLPDGIGPNATLGQPDGTTTNRGTFRLRRARIGLKLTTSTFFGAAVEIDPNLADRLNPQSGTIARRLELTASSRGPSPKYELGAGMFSVPFSRDLAEPHASRIFSERAAGTRAMFPEDADLGVRLRRSIVPLGLTVDLAVVNGVTAGEASFGKSADLNKTKDVTARVAIKLPAFEAGVGGYAGQSQAIDPQSLRVQQRSRAAIGLDALFRMRLARGFPETRLLGEVIVGRNMDRGVLYPFVNALTADPAVRLPNFDPRSTWVRLEQDFRNATIGFRYDVYTPDGTQHDNSRHTFAFAVARSIGAHGRVILEFDHVLDDVHPPGAPSATKVIEVISATGQLRY